MSRLGPVDHFLLMIDQAARRAGLPGNLSAIALELEGDLPASRLESALGALLPRLLGLRARLALAPFLGWSRWKDVPGRRAADLVRVAAGPVPDASLAVLGAIRDPLDPARDPLVDLRVAPCSRGGSAVVLRWFHPLLDARGADRLLAVLDEIDAGATPPLEGPDPFAAIERRSPFRGWRGFRAARRLLDATEGPAPAVLAHRTDPVRGFGLVPFRLSEAESEAQARASRAAFGGTGGNEHLLFAALRAFHRIQVRRGGARGPYAIPVAANLRPPGAPGPILGNALAFLHLRAGAEEAESPSALARAIRDQEVSLLGAGADRARHALLRAGRRLPIRRYERERFRPDGAPRESLWFSNVGEILAGREAWLGRRVRDVAVATAVPHPPGLLCLFFRRGGTLRGSVVHAEGVLDGEGAFRIAEFLREEMLAAPAP